VWIGVILTDRLAKQRLQTSPQRMGWMSPSGFCKTMWSPRIRVCHWAGGLLIPNRLFSPIFYWRICRQGRIRCLRIRVCSSVLSLKNNGTIRSLTWHPSMSDIVTGDRVLKYWQIVAILNHLSRNSTPASDDQVLCKSRIVDLYHPKETDRELDKLLQSILLTSCDTVL